MLPCIRPYVLAGAKGRNAVRNLDVVCMQSASQFSQRGAGVAVLHHGAPQAVHMIHEAWGVAPYKGSTQRCLRFHTSRCWHRTCYVRCVRVPCSHSCADTIVAAFEDDSWSAIRVSAGSCVTLNRVTIQGPSGPASITPGAVALKAAAEDDPAAAAAGAWYQDCVFNVPRAAAGNGSATVTAGVRVVVDNADCRVFSNDPGRAPRVLDLSRGTLMDPVQLQPCNESAVVGAMFLGQLTDGRAFLRPDDSRLAWVREESGAVRADTLWEISPLPLSAHLVTVGFGRGIEPGAAQEGPGRPDVLGTNPVRAADSGAGLAMGMTAVMMLIAVISMCCVAEKRRRRQGRRGAGEVRCPPYYDIASSCIDLAACRGRAQTALGLGTASCCPLVVPGRANALAATPMSVLEPCGCVTTACLVFVLCVSVWVYFKQHPFTVCPGVLH